MKNIVLDIVMGFICLFLIITVLGLFVLEDVIDKWKEMRI